MIARSKTIKFQHLLKKHEIDLVLVLYYVDLLYFAGTIHGNVYAIPAEGMPKLFTRRAPERAVEEIEYGEVVNFRSFKEIKKHFSFKNVGLVLENIPARTYIKLLKDLDLSEENVIDITGLYLEFRSIKEEKEIERIRKAGEITTRVYKEIKSIVRPGMREIELASRLEELYRLEGHIGENRFRGYNQIGLLTYVLSGESILIPTVHSTPYGGRGVSKYIGIGASKRKIEKGIPFVVDTVANYEGYHNDTTRTFVIGEPPRKLLEIFEVLKKIYNYIVEIGKDITCEDLYIKVLEKVHELGYSNNFMGIGDTRVPFIGHGIGIYVDEYPVVAKGFKNTLTKGMTIAIEPKIFVEEIGGVGLETTFEVTDEGLKPLCGLAPELFVI